MYKIIKIFFSILIVITTSTVASSKENFFDEALKKLSLLKDMLLKDAIKSINPINLKNLLINIYYRFL